MEQSIDNLGLHYSIAVWQMASATPFSLAALANAGPEKGDCRAQHEPPPCQGVQSQQRLLVEPNAAERDDRVLHPPGIVVLGPPFGFQGQRRSHEPSLADRRP